MPRRSTSKSKSPFKNNHAASKTSKQSKRQSASSYNNGPTCCTTNCSPRKRDFILFLLPIPFFVSLLLGKGFHLKYNNNFIGTLHDFLHLPPNPVELLDSHLALVARQDALNHQPPIPLKNSLTGEAPRPQLITGAMEFVKSRETAYQTWGHHKHWKLRGHGYLMHYHKLVLAADLSPNQNKVRIWNVHPETFATFSQCDKLILWVRVNGPEIAAGRAEPVVTPTSTSSSQCHWEFMFDHPRQPLSSGTYQIDAKLIFWNAFANVDYYNARAPHDNDAGILYRSACPESHLMENRSNPHVLPMSLKEASLPNISNVMAFKFYSPVTSCCEMCRRLEGCQHWATPPEIIPSPKSNTNGCDLFFRQNTSVTEIPSSRLLPEISRKQHQLHQEYLDWLERKRIERERIAREKQQAKEAAAAQPQQAQPQKRTMRRRLKQEDVDHAYGSIHRHDTTEAAQFLGCGWSFMFTLDFPCLSGDLDDHIYMEQSTLVIPVRNPITATDNVDLSWCRQDDEYMLATQLLDTPLAPTQYDTKPPVGRWVREEWPTSDMCPDPYQLDETESNQFPILQMPKNASPKCWHREDISTLNKNCLELNCGSIPPESKWLGSTLQNETQWMGIWRNFHCDYMDFTADQLSQCFAAKKIHQVSTRGASIAGHIQHYLNVRTRHVDMYDSSKPDKRRLIVHTLEWPHKLWRLSSEEWIRDLQKMPTLTKDSRDEVYFVTPFFPSSEREPYVHTGRALQLARLAEQMLIPKGYIMINVFDPSAAFTYDTSGQGDGLHLLGPPMKTIMTKVFHHMCSDIVQGSRS